MRLPKRQWQRERPTPELDEEAGPHRTCVLTRAEGERARMLRFVLSPDGVVVADLAARLPGRGMWLSAKADVIHSPRIAQAFSRASRTQVRLPDDLPGQLVAGLTRRIGEQLGLARRAGQAVAGYQKAREWLIGGKAALILEASDGSPAERAKFLGASLGDGVVVAAPLPAAALGAIFGRADAVHVAVGRGKLADTLINETERLAGVTGQTFIIQRAGGGLPAEGSDND